MIKRLETLSIFVDTRNYHPEHRIGTAYVLLDAVDKSFPFNMCEALIVQCGTLRKMQIDSETLYLDIDDKLQGRIGRVIVRELAYENTFIVGKIRRTDRIKFIDMVLDNERDRCKRGDIDINIFETLENICNDIKKSYSMYNMFTSTQLYRAIDPVAKIIPKPKEPEHVKSGSSYSGKARRPFQQDILNDENHHKIKQAPDENTERQCKKRMQKYAYIDANKCICGQSHIYTTLKESLDIIFNNQLADVSGMDIDGESMIDSIVNNPSLSYEFVRSYQNLSNEEMRVKYCFSTNEVIKCINLIKIKYKRRINNE